MKTLKRLGLVILTLIPLAGCVTKNPSYVPSQPISASNPAYVPDTNKLATTFGTISAVNTATAPADPYAPIVNLGVEAGLAIATVISGLVASSKNKKANNATAAATVLAANIPDAAVKQTIESAPTPAVAAAVAQHLQAVPNSNPAVS